MRFILCRVSSGEFPDKIWGVVATTDKMHELDKKRLEWLAIPAFNLNFYVTGSTAIEPLKRINDMIYIITLKLLSLRFEVFSRRTGKYFYIYLNIRF